MSTELLAFAALVGLCTGLVVGFWLGYEHWERHFNKKLMEYDD